MRLLEERALKGEMGKKSDCGSPFVCLYQLFTEYNYISVHIAVAGTRPKQTAKAYLEGLLT